MFYEASSRSCRQDAESLIATAKLPDDLPETLYGGLVPHAGWSFSGRVAAQTLKALLDKPHPPETIVLFGADHTGAAELGEVWPEGAWLTPVGPVDVDQPLAEALLNECDRLRANPHAHDHEHSLEVQLPLIAVLAPGVKIVPIAMPVDPVALEIGRAVGKYLAGQPAGSVTVIGSTDLTHHGGHFGNPGGHGRESEAYARKNDSRILALIETMACEKILPEAVRFRNACGAGAIVATVAAAAELGATAGRIIEYTNSYEIVHEMQPDMTDDTTVGYASVVFT
jgi:hypothetical protein